MHQPADAAAPALIRLARTAAAADGRLRRDDRRSCGRRRALSRPPLRPERARRVRRARTRTAARRHAIGDFVADIPLEPDHPSAATLDAVADGLAGLGGRAGAAAVGSARPGVLRPLPARPARPAAARRRAPLRGRVAPRDRGRAADGARDAWQWVAELDRPARTPTPAPVPPVAGRAGPLWAALDERADDRPPRS